ncbi:MAG: hypothetical protein QM770_18985 [Tepidisphaeraceae bacterium]
MGQVRSLIAGLITLVAVGCSGPSPQAWKGVDFHQQYEQLAALPDGPVKEKQLDRLCRAYDELVLRRPLREGHARGVITDARGNRLGYLKIRKVAQAAIDRYAGAYLEETHSIRCPEASFDVDLGPADPRVRGRWDRTLFWWAYAPYIQGGFLWDKNQPYDASAIRKLLAEGEILPLPEDPTRLWIVVRKLVDEAEHVADESRPPSTLETLLRPQDHAAEVSVQFPADVRNGQEIISFRFGPPDDVPRVTRVPIDGMYFCASKVGDEAPWLGGRQADYMPGDPVGGTLGANVIYTANLRKGDYVGFVRGPVGRVMPTNTKAQPRLSFPYAPRAQDKARDPMADVLPGITAWYLGAKRPTLPYDPAMQPSVIREP